MKKFLKFSMILALAIVTFSCSNDNTDVIPDDPQSNGAASAALRTNFSRYANTAVSTDQAGALFENNEENSAAIDNYVTDDCFTINFPVNLTNGGEEVFANNQEEVDSFINAGYYITFPITITDADGDVETIDDEEDLIDELEDCLGEEIVTYGDDCFEFVFPLGVVTSNGNVVTVNDELELFSLADAVGFDYPISVTAQTATGAVVITINDDDEFDDIYNDCYDIEPCDDCDEDYDNCFEIVYPITLVQNNGTVVTINDDDEFVVFLSGLSDDDYFVPGYPMTIEYDDDTLVTINSDEELEAAFDACED